MIVKIVKCSEYYWWYKDLVGQIFEVEPKRKGSKLYPIIKDTKYYDHNLAIEDVIDITEERNSQLNKLGI